MSEYTWLVYAVLSAVAAALVSVFGKIGLQGLDANTATVIRSVIMALFLIMVMIVQQNFSHIHEILTNKRAFVHLPERYCRRVVLAFLFCGSEIRQGFAGGAGGQAQRGSGDDYCGYFSRGNDFLDFRTRYRADYGGNSDGRFGVVAQKLHIFFQDYFL